MNKNKKIVTLLLVLTSVFTVAFAQGTKEPAQIMEPEAAALVEQINNTNSQNELFGASAAQSTDEFTLEEMLQYAIEDERLALAEYEFIMKEFNVSRPFSNIIKAEQSHEKALLNLYDVYGFEVSDFDATSHVVLPDSLSEIYDIGVEAEIANIAMYDKFLSYDLPDDVRRVFEALKKGSLNHLDSFKRQSSKY